MAAPKFYNIQYLSHPGYNLSQRGKQVMLAAENRADPYQLWYIDESWKFLDNCPVVLINHGSKKALDLQTLSKSRTKVTMSSYDPVMQNDNLFWMMMGTLTNARITLATNMKLALGLGESNDAPAPIDSVCAILVGGDTTYPWKFVLYVPTAYNIHDETDSLYLSNEPPPPYVNVSFDVVGIVAEPVGDIIIDDDDMIWYRFLAGGQDGSNVFIIISRCNGLALKGYIKHGKKVFVKEYNVLDYDFVWAETQSSSFGCSINLSKTGSTNLHWCISCNHSEGSDPPLILCSADKVPPHSWNFFTTCAKYV